MPDSVTLTDDQKSELRAAASEIRVLAESIELARWRLARELGMTHNGERDMYGVLGYPDTITTEQYRELYERGGIAGPCVDALPKAVWRGDGELIEDKDVKAKAAGALGTRFEQEFYALNDQLKVWSTCMRAHILATLSGFSVLFLGVEGNVPFDQELPKGKPGGLLYLTPYGGGAAQQTTNVRGTTLSTHGDDVTIASWEESARSPRFGQPKTYQLRRTDVVSPDLQRPVHWSRVVHIPAEGFLDDAIFGPPGLRGVWNYFIDLVKIVGGGGEASWLRGNPITQFDTDKDMSFASPSDAQAHVDSMKAKADAIKHQLQRWIDTRGVKISQVGSNVADFSSNADVLVTLIAGTRRIPKRILTGSEMGQLASEQDRDNWNDVVKGCRAGYAHPTVLRPLIERLIAYGYLTQPKQWEPKWPDVDAMNETQKLTAAETAAKLNDHGEKVITGAEIREKFLGMEPLEEDLTAETQQVDQLVAAIRGGGVINILAQPPRSLPAPVAPLEAIEQSAPTVIVNTPKPRRMKKTFMYSEMNGEMRPTGVVEEEV